MIRNDTTTRPLNALPRTVTAGHGRAAPGILPAPIRETLNGAGRHARLRPLGAARRTRRHRARRPCGGDARWTHRRRAAHCRSARHLRAGRTRRTSAARDPAGTGQCAHACGHDAAARPGRKPGAGAVAAGRNRADRAALGRPRIRARRDGTGHRRNAAWRHHLLCRHAALARGGCTRRRRRAHARQRWTRGGTGRFALGRRPRTNTSKKAWRCGTTTAATHWWPRTSHSNPRMRWTTPPWPRVRRLADELEIPVALPVHESTWEMAESLARHGARPLDRLLRLGFASPLLVAVHGTQLSPADIDALAACGAAVVHCPESNLKLGSGVCPAADLLGRGVRVALGTDGAASNNDLDVLSEMRTAGLLAAGVSARPGALVARDLLRMATLEGARVLGLGDSTGSLVRGQMGGPLLHQPAHRGQLARARRRSRAGLCVQFAAGHRHLGGGPPRVCRTARCVTSTKNPCSNGPKRGVPASMPRTAGVKTDVGNPRTLNEHAMSTPRKSPASKRPPAAGGIRRAKCARCTT